MKALYNFFHNEISGGIVLLVAAIAAIMVANSPFQPVYQAFLDQTLTIGFTTGEGVAQAAFQKPLILWINDFLMAIFFLYAGLEIKREMKVGALSNMRTALLPFVAAVCGMIVPALVYLFFTRAYPEFHHGWAISSATDIAFALGVLALASKRLPASVKILLLAIAVMDDLGAILVIALFYAGTLNMAALGIAALAIVGLFLLNRINVSHYGPYFLIGLIMWAAFLKSGIHPTIAGVILGFSIPMYDDDRVFSPIESLEHIVKPWVTFAILPVFAFANAGVSLEGLGWGDLLHPVTIGIAMGLFLGKQIGIFGSLYTFVKSPWFLMPQGARWLHIYGISLLCGIGFTMALFIGGLAFTDPEMAAYVRMGVISGSLMSAVCGYIALRIAAKTPYKETYE